MPKVFATRHGHSKEEEIDISQDVYLYHLSGFLHDPMLINKESPHPEYLNNQVIIDNYAWARRSALLNLFVNDGYFSVDKNGHVALTHKARRRKLIDKFPSFEDLWDWWKRFGQFIK